MIEVDEFNKLHIDSTNTKVEIHDGEFFILGGSLFAYVLSNKVNEYIKGGNGIESIHIIPLLEADTDPYYNQFGDLLTDLIKYIIFKDQTCVDKLIIATNNPGRIAVATQCINTNSRIISSTSKRFPTVEDALFKTSITDFNSVLSVSDNESWWVEPSKSVESDEAYVFEPRHPGDTPNPNSQSSEVLDDQGNKRYKYQIKIHKWNLNIKKTYSKAAGNFFSSIATGTETISAYYYEKGNLIPEVIQEPETGD